MFRGRSWRTAWSLAQPRGGGIRNLRMVDWFNNRRLLEAIGNIPPAQAEANFYAALETEPKAA